MPTRAPHPNQFGFVFDPPQPASAPAELAGLERQVSRAVAAMLKDDVRPREVLAAEMSLLLEEDVSRYMLDAYSSPARPEHKVPASRLFALVAVTNRFDLLDRILREIGAAVLVGDEVNTAYLGQIDRQIAELQTKRKRIAAMAPIIKEGSDR